MIGEGRFGRDLQVSFALLSAMVDVGVVLWERKKMKRLDLGAASRRNFIVPARES